MTANSEPANVPSKPAGPMEQLQQAAAGLDELAQKTQRAVESAVSRLVGESEDPNDARPPSHPEGTMAADTMNHIQNVTACLHRICDEVDRL